jgi:hypothetical protein
MYSVHLPPFFNFFQKECICTARDLMFKPDVSKTIIGKYFQKAYFFSFLLVCIMGIGQLFKNIPQNGLPGKKKGFATKNHEKGIN